METTTDTPYGYVNQIGTANWREDPLAYEDLDEWIEYAWGEEFYHGTALMQRLKEERFTYYLKVVRDLADRQYWDGYNKEANNPLPRIPSEADIYFPKRCKHQDQVKG